MYKTLRGSQEVYIHPSSVLFRSVQTLWTLCMCRFYLDCKSCEIFKSQSNSLCCNLWFLL